MAFAEKVHKTGFFHDCGLAVDKGEHREKNEDRAVSIGIRAANGSGPSEGGDSGICESTGVYAIADGMGGHSGGEIASQTAIHTAVREVMRAVTASENLTDEQYRQSLARAVKVANHVIYQQNDDVNSLDSMGTTLVLALIIGNRIHIASVGDSRAYLISPSVIQQVTHDHSMTGMLVERGVITRQQALWHPYHNVLVKAVGMEADLDADTFTAKLPKGGRLLLCSDGLTNELEDHVIHQIVLDAPSPQAACDALVEAANRAGGRDNISVVLVEIKPLWTVGQSARVASLLEPV